MFLMRPEVYDPASTASAAGGASDTRAATSASAGGSTSLAAEVAAIGVALLLLCRVIAHDPCTDQAKDHKGKNER